MLTLPQEFSGTTLHVGPGSSNSAHCLSRAVDESQTAQCNKDFTNSCLSMGSYEEFRDCFELGYVSQHNHKRLLLCPFSVTLGNTNHS